MATARQIFPNTLVVSGYGVTELGGGATGYQLTNPKDIQFMMQKPISTGRPLPGFAYKVRHLSIDLQNVAKTNKIHCRS